MHIYTLHCMKLHPSCRLLPSFIPNLYEPILDAFKFKKQKEARCVQVHTLLGFCLAQSIIDQSLPPRIATKFFSRLNNKEHFAALAIASQVIDGAGNANRSFRPHSLDETQVVVCQESLSSHSHLFLLVLDFPSITIGTIHYHLSTEDGFHSTRAAFHRICTISLLRTGWGHHVFPDCFSCRRVSLDRPLCFGFSRSRNFPPLAT